MNPNERQATRSGAISATTRRAGPIIRPAAFSVALVDLLLDASSGLAGQIIDSGSNDLNSCSRPWNG